MFFVLEHASETSCLHLIVAGKVHTCKECRKFLTYENTQQYLDEWRTISSNHVDLLDSLHKEFDLAWKMLDETNLCRFTMCQYLNFTNFLINLARFRSYTPTIWTLYHLNYSKKCLFSWRRAFFFNYCYGKCRRTARFCECCVKYLLKRLMPGAEAKLLYKTLRKYYTVEMDIILKAHFNESWLNTWRYNYLGR